jgi:hypothetical protein
MEFNVLPVAPARSACGHTGRRPMLEPCRHNSSVLRQGEYWWTPCSAMVVVRALRMQGRDTVSGLVMLPTEWTLGWKDGMRPRGFGVAACSMLPCFGTRRDRIGCSYGQ